MIELGFVFGFGLLTTAILRNTKSVDLRTKRSTRDRLEKLWNVAQKAMREKKFIPAERALLTILKIDNKNSAAYNRLGILYARQKNFEDAVECFEIASSLDKKASSLHNVGLIYFEIGKLEKAADAFRRALELEPMAARYIAYAKVQQKLEKPKEVMRALEQAAELEPNPQTYKLLIEVYQEHNERKKLEELRKKLREMQKNKSAKSQRVKQPKRAL